jgi:hypothetical protein
MALTTNVPEFVIFPSGFSSGGYDHGTTKEEVASWRKLTLSWSIWPNGTYLFVVYVSTSKPFQSNNPIPKIT